MEPRKCRNGLLVVAASLLFVRANKLKRKKKLDIDVIECVV